MKNLVVIILVCLSLNGYTQGLKVGVNGFDKNYYATKNVTFGAFYIHNFGKVKLNISGDFYRKSVKSQNNTVNTDYFALPFYIGYGKEDVYFFTGYFQAFSKYEYIWGIQGGIAGYFKIGKNYLNLESKIVYNKNVMWFLTIGYGINLQK